MLGIGKFTEIESKLVVAGEWQGWGEMGSDGEQVKGVALGVMKTF